HLKVNAYIQGPQRCSFGGGVAVAGDFVTLHLINDGTRTVALSHVGGERMVDGIRGPFELHQHPRKEARLEPGEMRSIWILDARNLDRSVRWVGATDTLGRTWKLPRRALRRLFREEEEARRA